MFFKKESTCSCSGACNSGGDIPQNIGEISSIKVLGSGCKNCHNLKANVDEALKELGIDLQSEYITDIQKIISYNILSTPALVINEKVVSSGRVLSVNAIKEILKWKRK